MNFLSKSGRSPRSFWVGHAEATRLALAPLKLRVLSRVEIVVTAVGTATTACRAVITTTAWSVRKPGLLRHQERVKTKVLFKYTLSSIEIYA